MNTHTSRPFAVTSPFLRGFALFAITLAFAAALAQQAKADTAIDGAHSREEIAKACAAVGGTPFNINGKSGAYGCLNPEKESYVECTDAGACVGIPHKAPARYAALAASPIFKNQVQFTMPQVKPANN